MPRKLRVLKPLQPMRPSNLGRQKRAAGERVFWATWDDLVRYVAIKYGLNRPDARELLYDVFRYIREEVLTAGHPMRLPGFGVFRRYDMQHSRVTPNGGVSQPRVQLKFREWRVGWTPNKEES